MRKGEDDHEDSTIGNELDFPELDRSSVDDIQVTEVGILSSVQYIKEGARRVSLFACYVAFWS